MWLFKKKNQPEWIFITKKVRRTVYFKNGNEPYVSYTTSDRTTCKEWEEQCPTQDYHYAARARSWDNEWGPPDDASNDYGRFMNFDYANKAISINKSCIEKIKYEVVED
jgi:hypothetical protein